MRDDEEEFRRIVSETEVDRLRNTIVGASIFCTVLVCVTAVVCAWILR